MRRHTLLAAALLSTTFAAAAAAQYQPPPPRRHLAWITLTDGVGPSGGGLSGSTGLSQLFRAAATVNIVSDYGLEIDAMRIQEIMPTTKLLTDPTLNSPRADGIFASFAQFAAEGRGRGFPAIASIGGGVVRRPTNDPDKTRLTGAFQLGVEGSLWRPPVNWFDATAGLRLVLMPTGNGRRIYLVALTMGLRAG
jgi:hypothetical protein